MRPADETKRPAYLKIYEALRGDITSGAYALGERVPSKRTMAEQTDTSVITVEHAYNLLIDEGYIEAFVYVLSNSEASETYGYLVWIILTSFLLRISSINSMYSFNVGHFESISSL